MPSYTISKRNRFSAILTTELDNRVSIHVTAKQMTGKWRNCWQAVVSVYEEKRCFWSRKLETVSVCADDALDRGIKWAEVETWIAARS